MRKTLPMETALTRKLSALMSATMAKQVEVASGAVPGLKMIRYRNGIDSWWLRYRDPMTRKRTGVRLGEASTMSMADAISLATKMRAALDAGKSPGDTSLTLTKYFDQYFFPWALKNKRCASAYRSHFDLYYRPLLGSIRMRETTLADLLSFVDALPDHLAPATKNRIAATAKSIYRRAHDTGFIDRNPASPLKLKREYNERQRVLDTSEIQAIFRASAAEDNPLPGLLIRLLLAAGIRLNEALNAKFCDLDFDKRVLRLHITKNNKPRSVPLSTEALSVVEALSAMRKNEYLFPGRDGSHMARPTRAFNRIQQRAGMSGLWLHDFRRTACTLAINAGVPLLDASRFLGHSSIAITAARYAVLQDDRLHAVAASVGDAIRFAVEGAQ